METEGVNLMYVVPVKQYLKGFVDDFLDIKFEVCSTTPPPTPGAPIWHAKR